MLSLCLNKVVILILCCVNSITTKPAALASEVLGNGDPPTARKLQKYLAQGGNTGTSFDDFTLFNARNSSPIVSISVLNISHGEIINSIQVEYHLTNLSYTWAPIRGTSVNPIFISLGPAEHICGIEGSTNGIAVTQLTIYTREYDLKESVYGPFGKPSENPFSIQGYVVGFYGRSDSFLENLGIYYFDEIIQSAEFGPVGDGGSKFDDHSDSHTPPIVGISKLTFWHGDFLNGFQAEYILLGGKNVFGEMHGGKDATVTTSVTLLKGERIVNATLGHIKSFGFICLVTLTVKRINGKTEVVGPFGDKGVQSYNFSGNILGFYGHSGSYINRLGFYYEV